MEWFGLLLGLMFGAMSLGSEGTLLGGVVGWLFVRDLTRTTRIKALEQEVEALRQAQGESPKLASPESRVGAAAAAVTRAPVTGEAASRVAPVDARPASSPAVFAA